MTTRRPAKILALLAALVFAATLGTWAFTGAHTGWTKTSVTEMQHDEVTGIDYPVSHDKFVAGVEFLAAGTALAGVLSVTSLLLRRRRAAAPSQI